MDKLKKLFPISFKFCKSVKSLILCAILYVLAQIGMELVVSFIIEPVISSVLGIVLSPVYVFTFIIGFVLFCVALVLCYTVIGMVVGIPLMALSFMLMFAPLVVSNFIISLFNGVILLYCVSGFVVAVLSYAGVLDGFNFFDQSDFTNL